MPRLHGRKGAAAVFHIQIGYVPIFNILLGMGNY
jgi:hypothetical protein